MFLDSSFTLYMDDWIVCGRREKCEHGLGEEMTNQRKNMVGIYSVWFNKPMKEWACSFSTLLTHVGDSGNLSALVFFLLFHREDIQL